MDAKFCQVASKKVPFEGNQVVRGCSRYFALERAIKFEGAGRGILQGACGVLARFSHQREGDDDDIQHSLWFI